MKIEREVDVCIVGLGAVGGMAAFALTRAGKRVLALEAGGGEALHRLSMDELAGSSDRNVYGSKFNQEMPTWRQNAESPTLPSLYSTKLSNGIGGSSGVYSAISLRFQPEHFRVRSSTVERYGEAAIPEGSTLADWPLSYDDLEPYYDACERLLGVSGQAGNIRGELQTGGNPFEGPRSHAYPLPAVKPNAYGELFGEATTKLGYHPFPMPSAVLTEPYMGRPACTYCSFCAQAACFSGAKGSTAETVIPMALATGGLEIRTGCRVMKVVVDDSGEAVGVEYEGPDGRVMQPAGTLILASYLFENVRLMLASTSERFPTGVGNQNGQVGKHYIGRSSPGLLAYFPGRKMTDFTGPLGQTLVVDDLGADNFDHSGLGFIRGSYMAAFNQTEPIRLSGAVPPGIPRWGRGYKQFLAEGGMNSVVHLGMPMEILPYEANFLDLDSETRDQAGMPVIRITLDFYEDEKRRADFLRGKGREVLEAMGAADVWETVVNPRAGVAHDAGGARMGNDPRTSVVNSFGQVHDLPRLRVIGGSMFPSLPGMNPTLTMQAAGLRAAVEMSGVSLEQILGDIAPVGAI